MICVEAAVRGKHGVARNDKDRVLAFVSVITLVSTRAAREVC